jgi:hypothetical protein
MFDCVLPTRSGRNGQAFTRAGAFNLRNARFADDSAPLDETCRCPACRNFSRAYLHHVVKAKEIIASMLLTWHNLAYYQSLMAQLRGAIAAGNVENVAASCRAGWMEAEELAGSENGDMRHHLTLRPCLPMFRATLVRARSSAVEHLTFNQRVDGSIPSGLTNMFDRIDRSFETRRVPGVYPPVDGGGMA